MRIAYIYDKSADIAADWDVAKTFLDTSKTDRLDLAALLDKGWLHPRDVLVICAKSQLGHGAAAARNEARVVAIGATIEVRAIPAAGRKKTGRISEIGPDDKTVICGAWHGSQPLATCQAIAKRRTDLDLSRHQLNRLCDGSRSAKD